MKINVIEIKNQWVRADIREGNGEMKTLTIPMRTMQEKMVIDYRSIIYNVSLIGGGSIIYVFGLNGVLVPQGFLNGGLVGIVMLVHYLFPVMGIGMLYFLLNIPLVVLGWKHISRTFMLYSIVGIFIFSLVTAVVYPPVFTIDDPILAALLAGVFCGVGGGLILRSMGSAGGLDILSVYLNKKFGFRIGTIFFGVNTLVLMAGAFFYNLNLTLYSIVFLFTHGKVMDAIITGFNRRKSLLVISDKARHIADAMLERKGRGVTFLNGEGAFTGKEKKIIFSITSIVELPKTKEMILSLDPDAFIVVNDTLEVLGKRHGKGCVY